MKNRKRQIYWFLARTETLLDPYSGIKGMTILEKNTIIAIRNFFKKEADVEFDKYAKGKRA